jgi:hypothetical protein
MGIILRHPGDTHRILSWDPHILDKYGGVKSSNSPHLSAIAESIMIENAGPGNNILSQLLHKIRPVHHSVKTRYGRPIEILLP